MQRIRSLPRAKPSTLARRRNVTIIIEDKPPTYNWGWFSREEPRMHLQVVDRKHLYLHYKVWLETDGKRTFEPEAEIPAKILKTLERTVSERRITVEAHWISLMIKLGWLKVQFKEGIITLYAYPNIPNHFERTIELSELIPNEEVARKVTPQDLALNEEFAMLEIFARREIAARMHVRLEDILWGV